MGIRPGCIMNVRYKTVDQEDDGYGGYIDYMDRGEAVVDSAHSMSFEGYTDYMGNQEKSNGIFTEDKDGLDDFDKLKLKEIYQVAYERKSLLWQPIISFDNVWLEDNHIYDSEKHIIDEAKLREATRNCMRLLVKKENLSNAVWSAAIHYNTDNIHIHVGLVELSPSRSEKGVPGRADGRFKLKNINEAKGRFVNTILSQQKENQIINEIMRSTIIKGKENIRLAEDKEFVKKFLDIYEKLPRDKRTWKYNMNAMKNLRPEIDELSKMYIQKYHKDSYNQLVSLLVKQQEKYNRAYGISSKERQPIYAQNKIQDLHVRLGNAILKEMLAFSRNQIKNKDRDLESVEDKEIENIEGKLENVQGKIGEAEEDPYNRYQKDLDEDRSYDGESGEKHKNFWNDNFKKGRRIIREKRKLNESKEVYDKRVQYGITLLEKEALNGNVVAVHELGIYYHRSGEPDKARPYFKGALEELKRMESNIPQLRFYVQYMLGKYYYYGYAGEKNIRLAVQYLEQDHSEYADYLLGKIFINGEDDIEKNLEKAFYYFEKSAESGNILSSFYVGKMYLQGEGVSQNINEGMRFIKRAADAGLDSALYLLGKYYIEDEKTFFQGIEYLEKAAQQDNSFAQYKLGRIYLDGDKGEKDYKKAIEYLKMASENENQFAQFTLGVLYEKGEEVDQNYKEAFRYYQMSASQGNSNAQCRLGVMYLYGKGCRKNKSVGLEHLKEAADNGNKYAYMLLHNKGHRNRKTMTARLVMRDFEEAMRRLQKSMKSEYEIFKNIQEYEKDFEKSLYREENKDDIIK